MKRFFYQMCCFGICLMFCSFAQAQKTSAKLMEQFTAKMQAQTASEFQFNFSGADAQGQALSPQKGVVYRQGSDYAMINPELEVYVQGNTKWMYSVKANELVIAKNDPAAVDIMENPLLLFSGTVTKSYKLSNTLKKMTDKGVDITEVTLMPLKKNAPYSSILLRLRSQGLEPYSVRCNAKDGAFYEAVITKYITKEQAYPVSRFSFPQAAHPNIFVTDLRR